jgi:hypothetical protein
LQTFDTAPNCPSLNEIARAVVSAWQLFSGVLATSSALPMSTHSSLSVMAFSLTVFLFQARRRSVYIIVSAAMLRLRLRPPNGLVWGDLTQEGTPHRAAGFQHPIYRWEKATGPARARLDHPICRGRLDIINRLVDYQ